MIVILEKYEHNVDFHQIVDFVEASHIRIKTTEEGTKILATMDGKPRTISESLIRRNLKLNDEAGISSLPDAELFKNLALMGFNEFSSNITPDVVCLATNRVYNFSKMIFDSMVRNVNNKVSKFLMYPRVNSPSFSGRTVPLFDSMLVYQGEGSETPTEPHHTPSLEAQQSSPTAPSLPSLPPATTETITTVIPTDIPTLRQYSRRARIAQSLALPTAADEPTSPLGDDSQGEAFLTVSGLEAEQDRENNEMVSKIAAQDLEITSLKAKIKLPEDKDGGGAEPSGEDATINGRSLETGEEAGVEKSTKIGSNDTEELVNVLTSLDAASILTSGVQVVSVPHVTEVATSQTHQRRKKLQEQIDVQMVREMEEQLAKEDQRMNEQIAMDDKIARIHAEEELRMLIDVLDTYNEMIAKSLQEYEQFAADLSIGERIDLINELVKYQDHYAKVLKYQSQQRKPLSKKQQREFYMSVLKSHSGWKTKHFKGMTLDKIREKLIPVWKQIEDFMPMTSKEEVERFKRKGLRLEHDSAKKMKTSEEVSDKDLKEMMQDQEIFMLVEKDYHLRKGLAIVTISNKLQASSPDKAFDSGNLTAEEASRFPLLSERDAPAEEVCTADEVKTSFRIVFSVNHSNKVSHIVTLTLLRVTIALPLKVVDLIFGNNIIEVKSDRGPGFESCSP
nr:hypothetical protein [Tanacetum cinerariifolium]